MKQKVIVGEATVAEATLAYFLQHYRFTIFIIVIKIIFYARFNASSSAMLYSLSKNLCGILNESISGEPAVHP